MRKPKMIIFDCGHTLIYAPEFDPARGTAELMKYAVRNPHGYTVEDVRKLSDEVYGDHFETVCRLGYETSVQTGDKIVYQMLGIEFDLTPVEMETVFWNAAAPDYLMPGADKMIEYINSVGIRSGVISNLIFSGDALADRINCFLPQNKFEFIMSSSDYFFRKPNRYMFDIAIERSGLSPDEIWYCGDDPDCDVVGAYNAGIFPVWYDNDTDKRYEKTVPSCEHLHIKEWDELIDLL